MVQKAMAEEPDYQSISTIQTVINSKRRQSFPRRLPTKPRLQKEVRSSAVWGGAMNGRKSKQTFTIEITVLFLSVLCALHFDGGGWCSGAREAPGEHALSGFFSSADLGGPRSGHLHPRRP